MTVYTWSPTDKDSSIALSLGNLKATVSTNSHNVGIRGTVGSPGVGRYFEVTINAISTGGGFAPIVGLANSSQVLTNDWLGDTPGNGIGWSSDGWVYGTGGSAFGRIANTGITYGVGDNIGVLLLASTAKIYKNGTLVYTFTSLPTGALFPAISFGSQNDAATANFGASTLAHLPAGSASWDGTQSTINQFFSASDFTGDFLTGSGSLVAGSGTFALTGRAAALSIKLPLGAASYGLTGRAAGFKVALPLQGATYAITGRAAAEVLSRGAGLSSGTYTLGGRAASFQGGIPVGSGVYALTGRIASLSSSAKFGLYSLTGNPAGLKIGESLTKGTFTLTGYAAASRLGKGLALGSGAFKTTGGQVDPVEAGDLSGLFFRRLKSLIPRGWVLRTAPIFDAVLGGLGDSLANFYILLQAVKSQTRIATASGWFLDLIGWDFLGANYLRKNKEIDDHWRARIIREVLRPRATRLGIETALEDLTGRTPKIYEPWNATDDGGGYGAVGGRIAYGQSGYYGSVVLPAQVFVTAYKTGFSGIPNITGYGYGNGGYGVGKISYASLTQVEGEISDAEIFDCVHQNIAAGAKAWVAISA